MAPPEHRDDEAWARGLDERDPLRHTRDLFEVPAGPGGAPSVYLVGNSLGAQPKAARAAVERELDDWARLGVEGHFGARTPWYSYHEVFRECGARLVGARPGEVVMMNSLTVNLHLLLVSFYRPTAERYRILIEDAAFPSDSYVAQTQAEFHGLDPARAVLRARPRAGEQTLRTEDLVSLLESEGRSIAVVMLSGVNYFTGEWFDMERITAAGRAAGCVVGWDLAHAAGNVPVRLHEWGADFAAWCSYKYLNAGPGAVAGCFVHERHGSDRTLRRFGGWWGNDPATRFAMGPEFVPRAGADGWQLSNPPILAMAPLRASLEIFDRIGMAALREKSVRLTGYLEWLLTRPGTGGRGVGLLTPSDPARRGCQLSVRVPGGARAVLRELGARGIVCDMREPDVIRAAPVPLYTTFHDAWVFARALREVVGV
ncbi:MAG TPA: kynureninase [Phycisphaerales bacterium]|nr:kynureninase [Phycisphaerales bacterium]